MLKRWAIKTTNRVIPRVVIAFCVLAILLEGAFLRWRDAGVLSGITFGLATALLFQILQVKALREVIDEQSRKLAELGQQTIPAAKPATVKDELRLMLIAGLIFFALFLMSRR